MDLPHRFQYLSIETLWPHEEREQSILAGAQPLSPLVVLNICIRRLRLFRDCPESHIRDVRVEETHQAQRDFPCRDRERLIGRIAVALEVYEDLRGRQNIVEQVYLKERLQLMADLRTHQQAFLRWFRPGGIWKTRIARQDRFVERKL